MNATEYNTRRAAAEQDLDRAVEAWRQQPALPTVAKAGAWMTGLLTTAACIGFATGGPIGAMVWPVIVTLPAMAFSGLASGLSDTEQSVRENHRQQAYAAAGIKGVRDPSRGPSLLDRLAQLIGRRPAAALEKRARADLASGIWSAQPDVRYRLMGDTGVPDHLLPPVSSGPVTKIRLKADGEALVTHSLDGKLQSTGGRPSSVKIDADGQVLAAAWHDQGTADEVWKAGQGIPMTINVELLASECYTLAEELRINGGQDGLADTIDQLARRALDLGRAGHATLPLTLDADGRVSMDALDEYVAAATNGASAPRR